MLTIDDSIPENKEIEKRIRSAVHCESGDRLIDVAASILCQEWVSKERPVKVYVGAHRRTR